MSDFDVGSFVRELEDMGVKLSAIRFANGSYRVCQWHFPVGRAQEAKDLWQLRIGNNQSHINALASYLSLRLREAPPPQNIPVGGSCLLVFEPDRTKGERGAAMR